MFIVSPILRLIGRILSYILYGVTLLAAFGGKVDPQYMTLPAMLVLILPYLVIATLIVSIIWFLNRRIIPGALGIVVLVAGWSSIGPAVPISFPNKAPEGSKTFTILTFNSLHLDDLKSPSGGADRAVRFLLNCGADIICLQELEDWNDCVEIQDLTPALRDSLFARYPFQAGSKSSDLKVLSRYPVELQKVTSPGPFKRAHRYDYFRLRIDGRPLDLINMHISSYSLSDKERQVLTDIHSPSSARHSVAEFKGSIFNKMRQSFRERARNVDELIAFASSLQGPLIVCGDFNDVPSSWAYRKMIDAGFQDAYSETSFGPTYTYNKHLFLFHIDQIFYRGALVPLKVSRLGHDTSDHYPLIAEFALENTVPKR